MQTAMARPFDIKPMVMMIASSVLLAASLIVVDTVSSDEQVETAALRVLDESAARIAARQVGGQTTGRLVVAPSVEFVDLAGGDDLIIAEVASAQELRDAPSNDESVVETARVDVLTEQVLALPAPTTTTPDSAIAPIAGSTVAPPLAAAPPATAAPSEAAIASGPRPGPAVTTTTRPTTTTTRPATTTTTRPATTTTTPPAVNGRYSVQQVIFGTIASGDGSNPNEESPMGRHDAPLFLPQGWNWAQGPSRNGQWGNLRSDQFAEWRCAVIPELNHVPPVPFRINVRNGAYYQFANGSWNEAFEVDLDSNDHGAYLGRPGQINQDPFGSGGPGRIEWRQEADGSFSAPWNPDALMMHFWAGRRQSPASGQTAEFLTSELRLQQPDGQQVDLSQVRVLFQCGIDYYNSTGGQGTQVPGPGIATYQLVDASWTPGLWVTLPGDVPAASTTDFRNWLEANLPPDVRP